jgi:NAD-dependent SIR2 family protein deacetylase
VILPEDKQNDSLYCLECHTPLDRLALLAQQNKKECYFCLDCYKKIKKQNVYQRASRYIVLFTDR